MHTSAQPTFESLEARTLLSGSLASLANCFDHNALSLALGHASPLGSIALDAGDTMMSAQSVRVSRSNAANISGSIFAADDTDYFGFVASRDGVVRIGQSRGPAGCKIAAFDDEGNPLPSGAVGGAENTLYLHVISGQHYYLRVTTDGAIGRYRLRQAPMADDYADTTARAASIALVADGSARFKGKINYPGDVDLRALTPFASGQISIQQLTFAGGGMLDIEVLDSLGQEIVTTTTDQAVSFQAVASTTYYVKLSAVGAAQGTYRLCLANQPIVPPAVDPVLPPPPVEPVVGPSAVPASPQATVTAQEVVVNGLKQLLILGTNLMDSIVVSQSGSTFTVDSQAGSQSFTDTIGSVLLYGFGGDDTLRVTYSVSVPTTIFGGDGSDQLFDAAQATATLDGGSGDNLLVAVGTPAVTLKCGAGLDSFWADTDDTILNASQAQTGAVHRISQFYQPFASDATSPSYVSTKIDGQSLTDPALDASASSYRNFVGKNLFVDGVNYRDIQQGAVGDCYFLASLASLAQQDAASTQQMIAPLGDGTYAVRFYRDGAPVYLRVDADLPITRGGSLAYDGFGAGSDEIWAPLVEKAYCFFRNGGNSYASIDSGWMTAAYRDLTGKGSTSRTTNVLGGGLATWIKGQLDSGQAVTMGTDGGGGPIVGGHAYMVQSVSTENGAQYITVYNPWGVDGGSGSDASPNDGLIELTVNQVASYFSDVVASLA